MQKDKQITMGRSMLEMLAVLAVVGVLSIVALVGFRAMFTKNEVNELYEDLQRRLLAIYDRQDLMNMR